MNKKTHSQVFDVAAREHIPDHVDLTPQIMARIQKGKGLSMNPKLKILVTVLAVTAVFAITLVNAPTVVHALQALFGYIPGVGMVNDDGSLRVLTAPVSQTKDGVTVTIQQGTVDSSRTILTMTTSGLQSTEYNVDCVFDESKNPQLRLPDGTKISMTKWIGSGPTRYDLRYYFPSLPVDVNAVTLEIPCLIYGLSVDAWEIPLQFGPATSLNPFSVLEVDPTNAQTVPQSPLGIVMVLERVVPLEDSYLFTGSLKWGDGNGPLNNILSVTPDSVEAVDAAGHQATVEWVVPDNPDPEAQIHEQESWSYKVSGDDLVWPLTLHIAKVQVARTGDGYGTFELDLGQNPQMGQRWTLNEELDNHSSQSNYLIHINTATMISDPNSGKPGILFQVQTSPDVMGVQFEDAGSDGSFTALWGQDTQPGYFSTGLVLESGMSSGKRMFMVGSIAFIVQGDWQITWQP